MPDRLTRVSDANVVHLENEIPMNGSFRFFIFGGKATPRSHQALTDLANGLQKKGSFYESFSGTCGRSEADLHHDMDNPHSKFFTVCLVLASKRSDVEIGDLPALYRDYGAHVYADELEDLKVPGAKAAAHAKMGLRDGGVVVLRPDGHVGCVVALEEGTKTVEALEAYFASFMNKSRSANGLGRGAEHVSARL